jgi:hypothetical protein
MPSKQQAEDEARRKAREAFFDWLFTKMAKRQLTKMQAMTTQNSKNTT